MVASIIASILKLLESILGIFKTKAETKQKEFEIRNTEEQVRRAELVIEHKVKDDAEKLVKDISNEKDEVKKNQMLDELRKRVAG